MSENTGLLSDDSDIDNDSDIETGNEGLVCRICFDNDGTDLFRPCRCTGSMALVHRSCLDQWRAYGGVNGALDQCSVCHYRYRLSAQLHDLSCLDRLVGFFADHCIFFYICNQIVILVGSFILQLVDRHHQIAQIFNPLIGLPSYAHTDHPDYQDAVYQLSYYMLASLLLIVGWTLVFVFNLIWIRNRRLYLASYFQTGCRNINCILLVCLAIAGTCYHPFLGTIILTLIINAVFTIHYRFQKNLREAQNYIVLPYSEETLSLV